MLDKAPPLSCIAEDYRANAGPRDRRLLMRLALQSAQERLKELGVQESDLQPFFDLGTALGDLDAGITPEVLTAESVDRRKALSSPEWRGRAAAVVAVEALIADGMKLLEAEKQV